MLHLGLFIASLQPLGTDPTNDMTATHEAFSGSLDDESPDVATVTQIVATAARDCIALFTRLAGEDGWAGDQQARFNVWATNIGVFARGHASLDYRLRDTPDILDLMMQQVAVLKGNLSSLVEAAQDQGIKLDEIPSSHDSRPNTPNSASSELLSGSESEELPQYDAIRTVEETVTRLYKLSAAIRKSGSQYRDLRAEKYRELGERLDDGTFDDLTARFEDFAMKMISYRVPRRENLDNGASRPIAELWLQRRLAESISRRRNRFWYWRKHQQKLERSNWISPGVQPKAVSGGESRALPITIKLNEKKSVVATEDTRHTPIDRNAFPKLLQSKRGSNATSASFVWKNKDEIPGPPDIGELATHFTCPLCFIICEVKEARGKYWMQHVIRDLKPFICVFEHCETPEKLFGSFREWISHMVEEQLEPEWHCASAAHEEPVIFNSQDHFEDHMKLEHKGPFSESQLSKFSERSMRQPFQLFVECPLCDFNYSGTQASEYEVQDILQRHVGDHLQSLALFSLPTLPNDGFTYAASEETSGRAYDLDRKSGPGSAVSLGNFSNSNPSISSDYEKMAPAFVDDVELPSIRNATNTFTAVLDSQVKYEKAENMYRQELESEKKALGVDHPNTLASMNNLASVLSSQGNYEEAEQMCRQALELRKKVLGIEHLDTLASINNLASVLSSQGKYEEARQMDRQVLELRERVLAKEDSDTLMSFIPRKGPAIEETKRVLQNARIDLSTTDSRKSVPQFGEHKPNSPRPQPTSWQPPPFLPPSQNLDKPVELYRRYSEDTERGSIAPFATCPRTSFSRGRNDWLTLLQCPSFDICPSCFNFTIAPTEFRDFFVPAPRRSPEIEIICDFGSSHWYRIAWLLTVKERRKDLKLFYDLANIAATVQPCLGKHEAIRSWYSIVDPKTGGLIRGFDVCYSCVKSVETLLPAVRGMFIRSESHNSTGSPRICDLKFDSKRFVQYFDALEIAADRADYDGGAPDTRDLASLVKRFALFDECRQDTDLLDKRWHIITQLPEFTVCGECFDEVVWPELEEEKAIPMMFNKTLQRIPKASCQLYSPKMRDIFKLASDSEDYKMLAFKARERKAIELVYKKDMAELRKKGKEDPAVEREIERLEEDWKKWE